MSILKQLANNRASKKYSRTFVVEVTGYENAPSGNAQLIVGREIESNELVKVALGERALGNEAPSYERRSVHDLANDAKVGSLVRCDRAIETAPGYYEAQFFHAITHGPEDQRGRHYLKSQACLLPTYVGKDPKSRPQARVGLVENRYAMAVTNEETFSKAVARCCLRGQGVSFDRFTNANVAYVREPGFDGVRSIVVGKFKKDGNNYRAATTDEMRAALLENRTFLEVLNAVKKAGACSLEVVPGGLIGVGPKTLASGGYQAMQSRYDANHYVPRSSLPPNPRPIPGFMETHISLMETRSGGFIVVGAAPSESDKLSLNGEVVTWGSDMDTDHEQDATFDTQASTSTDNVGSTAAASNEVTTQTATETNKAPVNADDDLINDDLDSYFESGMPPQQAGAIEDDIDAMLEMDSLIDEAAQRLTQAGPRM